MRGVLAAELDYAMIESFWELARQHGDATQSTRVLDSPGSINPTTGI